MDQDAETRALVERAQQVVERPGAARPEAPLPSVGRVGLAAMIDHTVLKPEATSAAIQKACDEALQYRFAAVCVNPCYVTLCAERLGGSTVRVATVAGFPLGASVTEVKVAEARRAISDGAAEVDMVLWVGALKHGNLQAVRDDIRAVTDTCHAYGAICKVIIEAALLSDLEKAVACLIIAEAGADYCKTSTGFGPGGATAADVRLMREATGSEIGIKAAGGIRDYEAAAAMVRAGATRIGTSAGPALVDGAPLA
jgi:deoxyribose-phosphate aldolase